MKEGRTESNPADYVRPAGGRLPRAKKTKNQRPRWRA